MALGSSDEGEIASHVGAGGDLVMTVWAAPVEVPSGKRQAHRLSLGGEQGHLSEALTRLWWLVGKGCGGSF